MPLHDWAITKWASPANRSTPERRTGRPPSAASAAEQRAVSSERAKPSGASRPRKRLSPALTSAAGARSTRAAASPCR